MCKWTKCEKCYWCEQCSSDSPCDDFTPIYDEEDDTDEQRERERFMQDWAECIEEHKFF